MILTSNGLTSCGCSSCEDTKALTISQVKIGDPNDCSVGLSIAGLSIPYESYEKKLLAIPAAGASQLTPGKMLVARPTVWPSALRWFVGAGCGLTSHRVATVSIVNGSQVVANGSLLLSIAVAVASEGGVFNINWDTSEAAVLFGVPIDWDCEYPWDFLGDELNNDIPYGGSTSTQSVYVELVNGQITQKSITITSGNITFELVISGSTASPEVTFEFVDDGDYHYDSQFTHTDIVVNGVMDLEISHNFITYNSKRLSPVGELQVMTVDGPITYVNKGATGCKVDILTIE